MEWIALIGAGLCEIIGVFTIKRAIDARKWTAYLLIALPFAVSFSLLSYAMAHISMGTAYAIWTGTGTAGSALLGMYVFNEAKDWRRIFFIGLVIGSAVGLRLFA